MDDLIEAVRCIKVGKRFLVPRYDLIKHHGPLSAAHQLSAQQLVWNEKNFIQYGQDLRLTSLDGSTDLYVEASTGYVYSLFPCVDKSTYVIDGTLIMPNQIVDLYDLMIFVQASWPLRVARMIRRFNRKEVFGDTIKSMPEYVDFLVNEARSCADAEIAIQAQDATIIAESTLDTLSNYLDLVYLMNHEESSSPPGWASVEEIQSAMDNFILALEKEHDSNLIESLRCELSALLETKHLIALENTHLIFERLKNAIQ